MIPVVVRVNIGVSQLCNVRMAQARKGAENEDIPVDACSVVGKFDVHDGLQFRSGQIASFGVLGSDMEPRERIDRNPAVLIRRVGHQTQFLDSGTDRPGSKPLYRREVDDELFNKNKPQKGKTLFIDARNLGTMVTRKLRELTDSDTVDPIKRGDIQRIADTYNAYVAGKLENEKGFCVVTSVAEIAKQDFILTPGRYVGIAAQEEDTEPFEEKMTRLTGELSGLFEKSHELEAEIKKQLGSIGYKL